MAADKSPLEETTGYIGVGSVEMLGLLAMFDAQTGFYDLVKVYLDTPALFAIPSLALAYLLGLCTVVFWSQTVDAGSPLSAGLLAKLIDAKAEQLISRFCDAERQSKILGGSTVSLVILALGLFSELAQAAQFRTIAFASACLLLAIAVVSGVLSRKLQRGAAEFIQSAIAARDA